MVGSAGKEFLEHEFFQSFEGSTGLFGAEHPFPVLIRKDVSTWHHN
jgi:hypothetical protein